jgi:hypothetical protein
VTLASYLPQIAQMAMGIVGGGVLGTWLTHKRLGPKSTAEARQITAAAIDKDWARFEREIDRLVKRVERAEDDASEAKRGQRDCEQREIALQARIALLEAVNEGRGQIRQRAQEVVSAERVQEDKKGAKQ